MKAIFRPRFILDVEDTADCLHGEAGEEVALHWRDALKPTVRTLREHPELGRLRSDLPLVGIRTLYVKGFPKWLVFYRLNPDSLEFLRVKHGMMHLPGLFEPPSP